VFVVSPAGIGGIGMSEYKCAKCGRELSELDETCDCGNALGVMDL